MNKFLLLASVAVIGLSTPLAAQAGDTSRTDKDWNPEVYSTVTGDSEEARNKTAAGYEVDIDVDGDIDAHKEGRASLRGEESENKVSEVDIDADLKVDASADKVAVHMKNQREANLAIKEKAY